MIRKTLGYGVSLLLGISWPAIAIAGPAADAAPAPADAAPADAAPADATAADAAPADAAPAAEFGASASAEGAVEGPQPGDEPEAGLTAEDEQLVMEAEAAEDTRGQGGERWIRKYRPRANSFEFGIYGGIMLPSKDHELFDPVQDRDDPGFWKEYNTVAPSFGLRFAYYPFSFLGGELEGGAMPTWTRDAMGEQEARATLYTFHGHIIGQLPFWSVAPFLLAGGGLLGTSGALGSDVDPSILFGAGVKFFINDWVLLRLDIRDHMAAQRGQQEGATHYPEFLLGLSLRFGGKRRTDEQDSDGDGYIDSEDACPYDPENYNGYEDDDGCPEFDRDNDGFFDNQDACPDVAGVAPDGCPPVDSDGDGILDSQDACPNEPGVPPDGCPIRDTDGDGILDPQDQCVTDPETYNGYEDDDGCPDEVPEEVRTFSGVIQGIFFDFNKATIKARSKPVLDKAAEVLTQFPSLRVEISGHTDDKGSADYNQRLSEQRAASVKEYLVSKGVDTSRLEVRGAGEDEPIDSNKTARGRAKNRRIEFKILITKPGDAP